MDPLMAKRPAHIPAEAVYDFDIFHDAALLKDPHERAMALWQEAPSVFWTPRNGGHWMTTRFALSHHVSRTTDTYSSALLPPDMKAAMIASMPKGAPRLPQLTPIMMDPPEHTKFRMPLQRAFSPKTLNALKDDIVALANHLIDEVIDQGGCDFIPTVAEQLPVRVFLKMMGLPEQRLPEFRALVRDVFAPSGDDPMIYGMRLRRIIDAMMDVILARRKEPKSDLISMLWALEVDEKPVTMELMEDYAALLFLAGLDTVINGIGFGIRHLALHPELQQQLRENPELIPSATEELLRRYTFTIPVRRVIKDTELGGWQLKTNDKIMLYLPAADLDANEFSEPATFDATREHKTHMAFGAGPHHCLGSHLARLELQVLYRVVLQRLPEFHLDSNQPIRFHAGQMLTLANLPLRWN